MKLGNPIFADESGSHATSAKELDYKDAERYSWQPEKTDWSTPPTIQDDREDDEIVAAGFFVFGRISAMVGIFVRVLFRFFFKFSFTYFLFLQTPSSGIGSPTMANRSINHRPCGISSHSPPFFLSIIHRQFNASRFGFLASRPSSSLLLLLLRRRRTLMTAMRIIIASHFLSPDVRRFSVFFS